MSKIINLSPEALEIVNELCDDDELECTTLLLESVEEQMQKLAFEEGESSEACGLYSMAYQLKTLRKKFSQLKNLLYKDDERDK